MLIVVLFALLPDFRRSFGALAVAIWCAAVANASPSLAYRRFPLTGHFDSSFTTSPFGKAP
jgi:hypothetical protein